MRTLPSVASTGMPAYLSFGSRLDSDQFADFGSLTRDYRQLNLEVMARLAEAAPVGLALVQRGTGSLLSINPAGAEMLGVSPVEAIGRRACEFVCDRPAFQALATRLLDGRPEVKAELRLKSAIGRSFWAQISVQRTVLNGQTHLVISFADISHQKRREAALEAVLRDSERARAALQETQSAAIDGVRVSLLKHLTAVIARGLNEPIGESVTRAALLLRRAREIRWRIDSGAASPCETAAFVAEVEEAGTLLDTVLKRGAALIDSFRRFGPAGLGHGRTEALSQGLFAPSSC